MSLDLPIQLHVEVFSSDDTDAPPLSDAGGAGEVKTLLKACLSTGYGTKAPATGWSMPYEDGDKAVFKSTDLRATGFCMRLDNNATKAGNVTCYEAMSDIDTGTNQWFSSDMGFYYNTASNPVSWKLFATPVAFLLVTESTYNTSVYGTPFWFGDMMSFATNDIANCALWGVQKWSNQAYTNHQGLMNPPKKCVAGDGLGNVNSYTPNVKTIATAATSGFHNGHLGHPVYFDKGNKRHLVSPILVSEKRERVAGHEEILQGRPYWVATVGIANSGNVHFIPTDYWLL
ncbi:MAG: hypothetical protein CR974_04115 [Gammaproteobacteria bacterium]|nr:MAG: hypothetical protein CR974_04115 [Gammaproteobacteria bacterium]